MKNGKEDDQLPGKECQKHHTFCLGRVQRTLESIFYILYRYQLVQLKFQLPATRLVPVLYCNVPTKILAILMIYTCRYFGYQQKTKIPTKYRFVHLSPCLLLLYACCVELLTSVLGVCGIIVSVSLHLHHICLYIYIHSVRVVSSRVLACWVYVA